MRDLVDWELIVKYNKKCLIDHQFKMDSNQRLMFINYLNVYVTKLKGWVLYANDKFQSLNEIVCFVCFFFVLWNCLKNFTIFF